MPARAGLISIHALHEESDPGPAGRRQGPVISIHALHEESVFLRPFSVPPQTLSIHALHEESDLGGLKLGTIESIISIHALHEESDGFRHPPVKLSADFNPRSP